jgi:hypothetical protein
VLRQFKADFGKLKLIIDKLNHPDEAKAEAEEEKSLQLNLV